MAIQDFLEGVDRALVAFVAEPNGAAGLRAAVDLLTDSLLTQLSCEERELIEPLARYGLSPDLAPRDLALLLTPVHQLIPPRVWAVRYGSPVSSAARA